jgi:hypothetical protein
MVNRDNTLTVKHLIAAVKDGRVGEDIPVGVIFAGLTSVHGINSFEVHTYADGSKVLVAHTEPSRRLVAAEPGQTAAEVGL